MYWFTGTSFSNAYKYHIEKKKKIKVLKHQRASLKPIMQSNNQ